MLPCEAVPSFSLAGQTVLLLLLLLLLPQQAEGLVSS